MTQLPMLKGCPFCGADIDDFAGMIPEAFARCVERGTFAMGCSRCDATGPMKPSMEEAIEAWNAHALASRDPEAAKLEMLVEALDRQGRALAAWVNLLQPRNIVGEDGDPVLTGEHSWLRDPTKAEVQAALEAQNEARAALGAANTPEQQT